MYKIEKKDWLIMLAMSVIYAFIAFLNLGDTASVRTYAALETNASADFTISGKLHRVSVYNGRLPSDGAFIIETSADGINYEKAGSIENLSVYAWHTADIDTDAAYIRLTNTGSTLYIGETAFFDENENLLAAKSGLPELTDEQSLAAYRPTYMNGTYFDEIYHARTAWEYTNGVEAYEWTHPPLGKLIISVGIKLFGMTPFGWRFAGTLFGVLMIPIMYLFAAELFGKRKYAFAAAFLMMFDFMHFTQTRIATIDTYAVFFIMLMYLFMYKFTKTNFNLEGTRRPIRYLFLSGLFFGLGAASKWTCLYAGAGLAIIFFLNMYPRLRERAEHSDFWHNMFKIIISCVLFFVIIPILIYWVSYLPYAFIKGNPYSIFDVFKIQKNMFEYHSQLKAEHFFSSMWYQWPIMYKPIWYFSGGIPEKNLVSSISAFGNPAIWWTSIPATAAMIVIMIKKRREGILLPLFILIGYAAQYLPWVGVSRVVFIYHYFTSVPFIILIIVYVMRELEGGREGFSPAAKAYFAAVVILFIMFYPAISGMLVPKAYMKNILMWFGTWYFGG